MTNESHSPPLEISCIELQQWLDGESPPLLLDCRERDEHEIVRISTATLLPMSEIQARVGELESLREAEIVVLCHHGVRSRHVTMWLRQQGFLKAKSLAGGIDQWAAEIDPSLPRY